MRILVALDKFKGSMGAGAAVNSVAEALRLKHPDWTLDLCPLTDGGDGFAEILTRSAQGTLHQAEVTGPLGQPVTATFGLVSAPDLPPATRAFLHQPGELSNDGLVAVVEMAMASGLALLTGLPLAPSRATSNGTGALIRAAQELGAKLILCGVGGSATHDLGLGALEALGFGFLARDGSVVSPPNPARWTDIAQITRPTGSPLPPIRIVCDVSNPLLGPNGAAQVYALQKGFAPGELAPLDAATGRMARLLCAACGQPEALIQQPGAGAAGGIAFGFMVAAGAQLVAGSELVNAWLDLEHRLEQADIIITGEGRFDASSLQGKGPGALATRALAVGKPVHVFAGRAARIPQCDPRLHLNSITPEDMPWGEARRQAPRLLTQAVHNTF